MGSKASSDGSFLKVADLNGTSYIITQSRNREFAVLPLVDEKDISDVVDNCLISEDYETVINGINELMVHVYEIQESVRRCMQLGYAAECEKSFIKDEIVWSFAYISIISSCLNSSLENVLENNLKKLRARKERGTISGSGDDR